YIRTRMTANNAFPMPGLMEADRAAALILRAIADRRVRVAFPWWVAGVARATALLPPATLARVLGRVRGKALLRDDSRAPGL
ncbi:MAG: hypothetical protein JOY70_08935, partial [Acidisphaera sp.]|nr:hypothetical protein [Acidisphaera sp.]